MKDEDRAKEQLVNELIENYHWISELRATETQSKRLEEELTERTEQTIRYQTTLLELAKMDNSKLDSTLKTITEVDSRTLDVERVSVWLFNEDRSEIFCENLYKLDEHSHENGFRLRAKDYPIYFQALEDSRTLAANDARTDPRTSEYAEGYLKPYGITSMMDIPIRVHGKVVGIVCHEHTGPMRKWTVEEQDFAASIADMVSLALEASERRRAEEELQKAHDELEIKVQERTLELARANQALEAEITERKHAAEDLNKRNKDLEILNTITQAVHKSFDLEEVYKIALEMTIALENVDMAMIYLVDENRNEAILRAHKNVPQDYILRAGRIPHAKGVTWKVINKGEVVNIEDIQKDPDAGPAGRDLGNQGVLGIPITLEEKVIGVIWFLSYKEHRFDKQEVDLLASIGNQIAISITKAKLYIELSKKSRYEKIISAVTQAVHQSINLQDVLENAVEALSKNVHEADSVGIYLVEEEEAVLKAHRGYTDQYIDQAGRIPYPKGVTWKIIIEGKPKYCADVDKDKVIGPAGREMGIKSYLCMPIHNEGKAVGTLNITSFKKHAFDEEELNLMGIIARQIEVAFNNARQVEALRDSEERYRALYEDNPSMYFTIDAKGKVLSVNQFGAEQLAYTTEELVGQSVLNVFHEEDKRGILQQLTNCLQNPGQAFHWEFRKVRKDGSMLWVREIARAVRGVDGNPVILVVCEDITERKQADEELRGSRERLSALATHLQSVREEERTLIAREIHDELGQVLTGLKMNLLWLDKKLSGFGDVIPRPILEEIVSISNLIDKSIQTVQEISAELRPGVLDDLGLAGAIEWQAQEFQTQMGIICRFNSSAENITLDKVRSTAIFRIFQEALTNVARHANAPKVNISLREKTGNLILVVRDNGKGITESAVSHPKSLGLLGMRERALLLGGEVEIRGTPGKGTKITVRIPLNK